MTNGGCVVALTPPLLSLARFLVLPLLLPLCALILLGCAGVATCRSRRRVRKHGHISGTGNEPADVWRRRTANKRQRALGRADAGAPAVRGGNILCLLTAPCIHEGQ